MHILRVFCIGCVLDIQLIIMSSLNSGDRDATLIDFPLDENSNLSPKASQRTSSSGFSSSYTGGLVNIDRLICRISTFIALHVRMSIYLLNVHCSHSLMTGLV